VVYDFNAVSHGRQEPDPVEFKLYAFLVRTVADPETWMHLIFILGESKRPTHVEHSTSSLRPVLKVHI